MHNNEMICEGYSFEGYACTHITTISLLLRWPAQRRCSMHQTCDFCVSVIIDRVHDVYTKVKGGV